MKEAQHQLYQQARLQKLDNVLSRIEEYSDPINITAEGNNIFTNPDRLRESMKKIASDLCYDLIKEGQKELVKDMMVAYNLYSNH